MLMFHIGVESLLSKVIPNDYGTASAPSLEQLWKVNHLEYAGLASTPSLYVREEALNCGMYWRRMRRELLYMVVLGLVSPLKCLDG